MSDCTRRAMSTREFANLYGMTAETVIALIRRGVLNAVDVSAGDGKKPRWRIMPEAIEAFESRRASRTPTPKPTRTRRALPVVKTYV